MSYDAELYAQLHRGTPGDVAFYVDVLSGASQVLELGCGYGRILTELVSNGHQVTGLDNDPAMLELTRAACKNLAPELAARVSLQLGDMRHFQLETRFDHVIIPFNGLYCMLSQAAVIDCLRCAAGHLKSNGSVVFDAYAIDEFHKHADPHIVNGNNEYDEGLIESIEWQGTTWDVYETCIWDRASQGLRVRYQHVPHDDRARRTGSLAHRYILTSQIEQICRQAGLRVTRLDEDFSGTRLGPEAEHMVCIAQPA